MARLRAAGIDTFPVGFTRTHTLAEVAKGWKDLAAGEESGDAVRVAGRIVLKRAMGKLAFWTLRQGDDELQVMLTVQSLGEAAFELALDLDTGDWVGVGGEVVRTRRGELARPFITHHNALDTDLYLRVACELYLKRLLVGGMDRVFELGRVFRNEGMDSKHNPEFTMLESNAAFQDYRDMMVLSRGVILEAADAALGSRELTHQGRLLDLDAEWREATMLDLVRAALDEPDLAYDWPLERVRALCDANKVPYEPGWGVGKLVLELYEHHVEDALFEPTFVTNYPIEVSPLAHPHRDDPWVTERFELVIGGREYANCFSELTDPDEQRARMEEQALAKAGGDEEAMVVDEAYLRALELGMPPNAGLGIGVDRLVMLLGGLQSIREAILFPQLRPEEL